MDKSILDKGIVISKEWASTIGLPINFTIKDNSFNFSSLSFSNDVNSKGYNINPIEIFQEAKKHNVPFDIALLVYDWTKVSPQPTNPAQSGQSMQIPMQWYATFPEVFAEFFLHELCHYFFQKAGKNDITHNYDPAFTSKPRKDWYLYLLKDLIKQNIPTPQPSYIFIKPNEVINLKPELVQILDKARGISKVSYKITSGFRTPEQNKVAGGTVNSSHMRGMAADIACTNLNRGDILEGLMVFRKSLFIELANAHIHVDIDSSIHPMGTMIISSDD